MDNIIWLIIMIPVSLLFTGIGIFAWQRKKPMWFWSGSTVKGSEISDAMNMKTGGILLTAGCIIGVPLLPVVYGKIYQKFKK